jgi:2'-5' RNA ligase
MSDASEARLFAAVELPEQLAWSLVGWAREAAREARAQRAGAGLRVLEPASLHLTLCFLGGRPADQIEQLVAALEDACGGISVLELSLGAPVWLPSRTPRALAVEIHHGDGALERLQVAVQRALSGAAPTRRFRPHITVARVRPGPGRPAQSVLAPTPQASFSARRVALVRSWLEPQGARYEAQGSVELEPREGPARSSGDGFPVF